MNDRTELTRKIQEYLASLPTASLSDKEKAEMARRLLESAEAMPEEDAVAPFAPAKTGRDLPPRRAFIPSWALGFATIVLVSVFIYYIVETGKPARDTQLASAPLNKAADSTNSSNAKEADLEKQETAPDPAAPGRRVLAFAPMQAVFTMRGGGESSGEETQLSAAMKTVAVMLEEKGIDFTSEGGKLTTEIVVISDSGEETLRFVQNRNTGNIDVLPSRFRLKHASPDERQLTRLIEAMREAIYLSKRTMNDE